MPSIAFNKTSRAAQFISRRIDELRPRKSQSDIASSAGFRSVNMLSVIKMGKAKLPMDRVVALAKALETDPAILARLAIEQFFSGDVLDTILSLSVTGEPSINVNSINATAVAVGVEVLLSRRDMKFCAQFLHNASSRAERVEERLNQVQKVIDELVVETRT